MTTETLDDHFDRLCEDIKRTDIADASELVAQDRSELDQLEASQPAEAAHYRSVVEDEAFLLDIIRTSSDWYVRPQLVGV